ncbi:MAG: nuclear transport factor 2 family protein [Geobacteraceae bacterium]|nr:nuclear transport factor 2 family protein [Geobacteraceae bacterium]
MEDQGAKLVGQITALLEQHDAAFAAQDIKGIMKTYVSGNQIFLMGTGPGEVYRGREGIEGAYTQFFNKFEKGSAGFTYNWVSAGSRHDLAWFAAEYTVKGKVKGETKEVAFNVSGTLQQEKGKWRFLALHFSRLGVTNEPHPK